MTKDAPDNKLTPSCELLEEQAIPGRGFRRNPAFLLEDTTNKIPAAKGPRPNFVLYSLNHGTIGHSAECATQVERREGVQEAHAKLEWNGSSDQYDLRDNDSETGTYLVLSNTYAGRETVLIHAGDEFLFHLKSPESSGKTVLKLENYVRIKIKSVSPDHLEMRDVHKKATHSKLERQYTFKRDEHSGPMISIADIDVKAIKNGFLQALERFDPSTSAGALAGKDAEIPTSKPVFDSVVNEKGESSAVRRNMLGGCSAIEENINLETIVCDGPVTTAALAAIEETMGETPLIVDTTLVERLGNPVMSPTANSVERSLNSSSSGSLVIDTLRLVAKGGNKSNAEKPLICKLVLEVHLKAEERRTFEFGMRDLTIGSHRSCDIVIPGLSAIHARIERDSKNRFWLRDSAFCDCNGTLLRLNGDRWVTLRANDVFYLGPATELTVRRSQSFPKQAQERWEELCLQVLKVRPSLRYRQLRAPVGHNLLNYYDKPTYCTSNSDCEIVIGRKVFECDLSVQDYDMPAIAATVGYGESKAFVTSSGDPGIKKKGIFLELSNRRRSNELFEARMDTTGKAYELQKGDTFRVGRCQLVVVTKKTETDREVDAFVKANAVKIQNCSTFKNLSPGELRMLAMWSCQVTFQPGEVFISQSEALTGIYIICEGIIDVFHSVSPNTIMSSHGPGGIIGEMSLFTGFPASASVRAQTSCTCLFIDYTRVRDSIHPTNFELIRMLSEHRYLKYVQHDIKTVPILANLDDKRIAALANKAYRVILDKGSLVIQSEQQEDSMFIITSGSVTLEPKSLNIANGDDRLSRRIHGGGYFYEEALTDPDFKPSMVATSHTNSVLLGLHRSDYQAVLAMSDFELEKMQPTDSSLEAVESQLINEIRASAFTAPKRRLTLTNSQHDSNESSFKKTPDSSGGDLRRSAKVKPADGGEAENVAAAVGTHRSRRSSVTNAEGEGAEGSAIYRFGGSDSEVTGFSETSPSVEAAIFSKQTELEKSLRGKDAKEIESLLKGMPKYLVLRCTAGPHKKQLYILSDSVAIIGRWTTANGHDHGSPFPGFKFISLNDRTVSRVNSMITYTGGSFWLRDIGSTYGTHIRLKDEEDQRIDIGDVISCSLYEFVVLGRTSIDIVQGKHTCCSIM